ncbi:SAM-dependent methyltransferase [Streptosporangium sp. CA-115845]|uniref:SAM-dependent methyltransferase n=1 Tax=Streptosporangium sp. CA-115845 TaxID=3240071 RepID=UPI003D8D7E58
MDGERLPSESNKLNPHVAHNARVWNYWLGGNFEAMRFWNEHAKPPIVARNGQEIAAFLDGLELLEPGLVSCSLWRPELAGIGGEPTRIAQYGAVGRKP